MKASFLSLLVIALAFAGSSSAQTTDTIPARKDTTRRSDTTSITVQAQSGTPTTIVTAFRTKYPNASNITWSPYDKVTPPIDWEMTGWTNLKPGAYVAEFDLDGQHYYAWYDASGTWIGSSSLLANHGDLPKAVRDVLVSKYNGYTIDKIEREYDDKRMVYEVRLKKTDNDKVKLHLSEQGTVLKEKKKD